MSDGHAFPLEPTPIHVPDDVLADLRQRLELTRWPVDAGNEDWYYGVNRAYLQELVRYWCTGYDWRKAEAAINAYEHYQVEVEGVPVHFMRRPGVGPDPHARMALDVLALVQGRRSAGRPRRVRRGPRRGVRRDRPLVSRLRLLRAAAEPPGHELLEGRRPLAHAHDRDPRPP
ncbi:hypothetical protein Pth03_56360 [Planotetraspora thailandica]|uniref:Epoxide hydrolase N-terminal domain-containing protein n=1 Tax=Planotetraspora thailandica TaxID=487172 RepID=A0A8J3XW58_9ACTN|nr:hypothetical protein Pth03_56360 [Planotetraspora thailandica]